MTWKLNYGDGAELRLELSETKVVTDCSRPRGTPLDDPSAAVAAAVTDPLEFPALAHALVPGDRVAIALDRGVPCAADVIAGLVQCLVASGHPLQSIAVVLADQEGGIADAVRRALPASIESLVEISVHDPADLAELCYLAASTDGKPLYFNRAICEADVVLPVSAVRLEGSLGYLGVHGGLFPAFSDEATQKRFRAPSSRDWDVHQRRRREEVEEAAWLLGVQFTVQITPGPGDSILQVVAGEAHAVAKQSQRYARAAWTHRAADRADLIVASIEGGPQHQTWDSFARALFSASRAVADGGAILLCTGLRCELGPALQRLTAADNDEQVLHDIRRDRSQDAISASLLAEAKQRARIYLLSDLDTGLVEDLGVGHVDDVHDIERLGRQFTSCLLLGNAQHAVFELEPQVEAV